MIYVEPALDLKPYSEPNSINFAQQTDFYTRNDNTQYYMSDILEISDELSELVLQIETCLFTRKQQVLGQHDFGINLEDLVFTLRKNESEIKNKVLNQIYSYCPLAPKYKVNVNIVFLSTEFRDVGYIDIIITDTKVMAIAI